MSGSPAFASNTLVGYAVANASADTSYTAPGNTTTVTWSGTGIGNNGAKITEVDYLALGTTLAGLINVFLYDGANYHLVDTVTIVAQSATTTAAGFSLKKPYYAFYIPTGWGVRITSTVGSQLIQAVFWGGNF